MEPQHPDTPETDHDAAASCQDVPLASEPAPDGVEPDASPPVSMTEAAFATGMDAALRRMEGAVQAFDAALEQQHRRSAAERQRLLAALEAAKAENARLQERLKAEQARVQRLQDVTAAVSGRVDSAIGELESILDS